MLLSDLKVADVFCFMAGEVVAYRAPKSQFVEMEPPSHISYRVLKVNEVTVKCETTGGRTVYEFYFHSFIRINKTQKVNNCKIKLV